MGCIGMINGCLPDGVVTGYCPSVGYSEISSEAEPTTKDTQHIINTWQYATIWCMLWHGNMDVSWANATSYGLNGVGLSARFKFQPHIWLFKCPLLVLSKTEDNIVQTCMKMVQMDSLNFSDNFSYIIYLIWSYVNFLWFIEVLAIFWNFLIIYKIN